MEPKIIDKGEIILVGMVFYGDPFKDQGGFSSENEIGRLWKRFNKKWKSIKRVIGNGGYEVHIEPNEYKETKNFYVFVGVEVDKIEDIPLEMFVKVLPPSRYAVFTCKGEEITSNWAEKIFGKWLPRSGYKEAHKYLIEFYDNERFKGMDNPESELDVYVPIRIALEK